MKTSRSRRLLVAGLASVLSGPALATAADAAESVHCYGVNKCKGVGDCGGKGRSCAGTNECRRQGYIDMDQDTCLRLDGGRLTEQEPVEGAKTPGEDR